MERRPLERRSLERRFLERFRPAKCGAGGFVGGQLPVAHRRPSRFSDHLIRVPNCCGAIEMQMKTSLGRAACLCGKTSYSLANRRRQTASCKRISWILVSSNCTSQQPLLAARGPQVGATVGEWAPQSCRGTHSLSSLFADWQDRVCKTGWLTMQQSAHESLAARVLPQKRLAHETLFGASSLGHQFELRVQWSLIELAALEKPS